jgi:rRNA maturation protein Rpf1
MRTLTKDLNRVIPESIRMNRGKLNIQGVAEKAIEYKADRVLIIERYKGGPGRILFYTIIAEKLNKLPMKTHLKGIKTQSELGERTAIKEGLAITASTNLNTKIKKLAVFFSNFFRIPYLEQNYCQKAKASMHFSLITKNEVKLSFTMPTIIKEVGPKLIIKL